MSQEKGRNFILTEGFSQKEKAEEGGVPAYKVLRREDQKERQGKEQFLSKGRKNNHSRRNGVVCIIKASTKYRR